MANQYTLTNDFAEIAEEKGTLYNKGDSAIELASTADTAKGAGILLLTGERRTFSGTLYARSMDAVGLLNVADFNDGGEGGEDDKTGGLPLGSVHPFLQTSIPDGWLSCENGQEVSRTAYPELWAWVQTNAPLITEAQWQTKAAAQKSVGYYSSGDGSTTFRLPRLVGFMEGVTAANVGAFTGAGLPNIVGDYAQSYIGSGQNAAAIMGAFTADATVQNADFQLNAAPGNTVFNGINFSASRSSAIYGNSNTVQPESVGMVWCVRAFGAAVNQGTVDITELAQMLNLKLSIADAPRVCTPFAFPSDTWVAIPLPSAYSTYVAPADGYVFATGVPISDSIPAYAAVSIKDGNGNYILRNISHSVFAANSSGAFLQVRKGDTVYIDIVNSNNGTAKFIYAQGEV